MTTGEQYDKVVAGCRNTFLKKTKDYGTSWRVYRTISIADQIYIKAKRIRTIQEKKQQKIEDGIKSEFEGMLNYAMIGLIQLDIKDSEVEQVDEEMLHMRKLLKTQLHDLDLSVRAYNCLKAAEVKTLGDLVRLDISDMMKFRNFGKKSLAELEQLVSEKNLTFGMDLAKYKLEED